MKSKYNFFLLIAFFIVPLLCSCWDKVELEEEGYVAAIGFDEGKGGNVHITFQLTNPKAGGTGRSSGGGDVKKYTNIELDNPGPLTARDLATISITRRITLSHAKAIIVGEKFAANKEFFHRLEAALRDKEMRRAINIIVSRERAADFIKNNNPVLEDRTQKFYEFMATRWKETGLVPSSDLNKFMQRTEQEEGLFLSIYGTTRKLSSKEGENEADYSAGEINMEGDNPVELIGSAVFKEGVMIGHLTGDETRLSMLLRGKNEIQSFFASFPDPREKDSKVGGRVIKIKRTKVNLELSGKSPKINVTVPITVEILAIKSFEDYASNMENQKLLKKTIEEYMEEKSLALVRKTQDVYKADAFLWELAARRKFRKYDDYKNYGWMEKYPGAEVSIKYEVKLAGFGKQQAPPHLKKESESQNRIGE